MPVQSPEDLYGLPLPRFIPERAALVKALRSEKRRDEATAVAAMRKPSVAAWAVNQLVRTQGASMKGLFAAGDEVAKAQSLAASGQPAAEALRAATRHQREAIGELVEAAQGLLGADDKPLAASTLERVRETLRAASIDSSAREQVQSGCLDHELEFAGLGIGDLVAPESSPPPTAKPEPTKARKGGKSKAAGRAREAEAAERAREAEAARKRTAALSAARKAQAEARRAATRAEKELAAAQTQHEDATAALQAAEERLAQAAERAETTTAELEAAQRSLDELDET